MLGDRPLAPVIVRSGLALFPVRPGDGLARAGGGDAAADGTLDLLTGTGRTRLRAGADGRIALPAFAGPAALLAGSEEADAGPGTVVLLGDSYPGDQVVEDAALAALGPLLADGAIRQAEIERRSPGRGWGVAEREAGLAAVVAGLPAPPVVIGRSSGARVAARCAAAGRIAAIIGLGYPFRHPGRPEEPARTAPLASLPVPMLILQGRADSYGGPEVAGRYAMAPCVEMAFLGTDHHWGPPPAVWAEAARRILVFLAHRLPALAGPSGAVAPPTAWRARTGAD